MNIFEMLLNMNNDSIKFSLKIFITLFIYFKKTSSRFNSFFKKNLNFFLNLVLV